MYRLMIKTHDVTGLKYLCITSRENWKEYTGSGTYWTKHLKKHGYHLSTELLFESEDYEEFLIQCLYFSELFNVALSPEFANLIPEKGYETDIGKSNLELWWVYATDAMKREVFDKRRKSLIEWYARNEITRNFEGRGRPVSDEIKQILSEKLSLHWSSLTIDERRIKIAKMYKGFTEFLNSDKVNEWKKRISESSLIYWANLSEEEHKERGLAISQGRLNMSDEAKAERGRKIGIAFAESEPRQKFVERMKEERIGSGNPAAKNICWKGEILTKMEFEKKVGKLTEEVINDIIQSDDSYFLYDPFDIKEYDIIICPHCGLSSGGKKLSSFKRWHLENCKHKE